MLQDALASTPGRTLVAVALASLVVLLALRARALAPSGAIAAIAIGTLIVAGGGWWSGLALVTFFVTSSALSFRRKRKSPGEQRRGSRRDAIQVLANGGPAALCAVFALWGSPSIWVIALFSSLAAANADTWATEIGGASGATPRQITTLRPVAAGTSGAISRPGTLASLAGALLVAAVGALGSLTGTLAANASAWSFLLIVALAGFAGCLIDSLLGATVQARYRCPTCDRFTENPVDACGRPTQLVGGIRWIDNDVVNVASVTAGALLGLLFGVIA